MGLVEPLWSDVLETESFATFSCATTNSLSFVLALKLDGPRAQLWQDNLAKALGGAGEKLTVYSIQRPVLETRR